MKDLSNREFEIMKILWHSSKALSANEIKDRSKDELSIYTIQQVLNRLKKKGFVQIADFEIVVKSLARKFLPTFSEADYMQSLMDPPLAFELTTNFIEDSDDIEVIDELEKLIEKKKKELQS